MHETQKKKILFVITKSNFGGAQRYVFELATNLDSTLYDVAVACGGNGPLKTKLEESGVRTYTIESFARDINLKKEIGAFRELRTILKKERPDIVHLNSSKAGGTGALASRLEGVPRIVYTAHGWPFFENRNPLWRTAIWVLSWITTLLAHRVIVVSAHDKKHARMWGLTRKISVAHTALPPVAFHAREEARAHLIPQNIQTLHATDCWLVTIAEHTSNKNLLTAIQAVARHNRAHAQKVFYTLIGDGQLTDELKKYVRAHHLEDSIFFAGYVEDARTYLKAFDCFILPSTKEGFPYALLEAGLARVPIIASDVGGIPELIHEKITGLLVDPHHTASLTEKITYAVEHPEEVRTWAGTLHQKVALDFSIDTMLTKTIRAYTD